MSEKGRGMFGFADIFSPWHSSSELDFAHLAYRKCCPPYLRAWTHNGKMQYEEEKERCQSEHVGFTLDKPKERSEEIRMSGESQTHKGKSYERMQWKPYHTVAWGYAQPIGNRLSEHRRG